MNKIFITLLFLHLTLSLEAQRNPDSLRAVWFDESLPVITRLEALQVVHEDANGKFQPTNLDTFFYHAQLQYDLAKEYGNRRWMAKALKNKGNYYFSKSLFKEAIDQYTQSKTIAEEVGDTELHADNLTNLGTIHLKRSEADQGILILSQSIELYQEIGEKRNLVHALSLTAMIYSLQKSDTKKALPILERALVIQEELLATEDNQKDRFILNGMKGTIKSMKESLEAITDTIDLDTYNPKIPDQMVVLRTPDLEAEKGQGGVVENSEDIMVAKGLGSVGPTARPDSIAPDEIASHLEQIIAYEAAGDRVALAERLWKLARIYEGKFDFENAFKYYLKSVDNSEALGDKNNTGIALENLGRLYYSQGEVDQSINHLSRSRELFKQVGNDAAVVGVNSYIANIQMQEGSFARALEITLQNLAYFRTVGNRSQEAHALSAIGNNYSKQEDLEKALEYYNEALIIFEEISELNGIARSAFEIGNTYYSKKDYKLALDYYARSLTVSKKNGSIGGEMLAHGAIASVYMDQKEYDKALLFGTKALSLAQKAESIGLVQNYAWTLSKGYKATGNYRKALAMTELHYQTRDSLQREDNQKAVMKLQISSEYEKQKAIDDVENNKLVAIETQKKVNQQKLSVAIGSGLFLISLLSLVIFNRLRVTRRQKAIIETQKKKVEQSEKYKEQFLANMSHEIRTPMHAISGMLKILERNEHPPSQDVFLQAMQTSSENLVVILNDVLDLSKIEAGKLDIEHIPVKPEAVLENVMQILKYKAEEKGLAFRYQIGDNVPAVVMGDPTRLHQVLLNLTGNAIKFSEKGKVEILLNKVDDRLVFSVEDTGIGIPSDRLENIFGAFQQAKDSTNRHFGGTGLGLSISKQLTELQNGKIWVESEEGRGSTFYVEFPIVAAAVEAIGQDLITEDRLKTMAASLKGIRILLAEDNAFNQMIAQDDLSFYFEAATIDVVENGALALDKFDKGNYDLILMDVQMPEMNGFEATRKIRNLEKAKGEGKEIPIIAMTASLLKSEVDSCYEAGMDSYIPKPYKAEELIGAIYGQMVK